MIRTVTQKTTALHVFWVYFLRLQKVKVRRILFSYRQYCSALQPDCGLRSFTRQLGLFKLALPTVLVSVELVALRPRASGSHHNIRIATVPRIDLLQADCLATFPLRQAVEHLFYCHLTPSKGAVAVEVE